MPVAYPIIITRMIAAANIPPGTFRLLRNPPADAMKLWMPELVFSNGGKGAVIGIGGHLAVPPLPHHRAYGSRTRRLDWVKLGQEHEVEGDRGSRSSGCAVLVERPGVLTCARTPSANRRRPLHGTLVRRDGAVR